MEQIKRILAGYLAKMKGVTTSSPRVHGAEILWSWIGSFLGIAAVAYLNVNYFADSDLMLIVGSFGASAVLIYGVINSPLAQPRNVLGGHILSAVVGVSCYLLFSSHIWFASSLAVSTAIALMHLTRTLHPPGGATALIAVIGGPKIHSLGYLYVLFPTAAGVIIMLVIALLVNNIPQGHRYPQYWR